VVVSEWLGVYGVDEYMLGSVLVARDRYLKPDGTMIPDTVTSWMAPVSHPAAQEAIAFHTRPYGLNLAPLAPFPLDQAVWLPSSVPHEALRAEPQAMWVVPTKTMNAAEAWMPFRADRTFRLDGGGVNGLVVWFSASMPGADPLSNGPGQPPTHWGQFLFPLARVGDAGAGDTLRITFECRPSDWGAAHHRWSASCADGRIEMHDTGRNAGPAWAPPWRVFQPAAVSEFMGAWDR
jgi:protein arginine N-methyltransferase 1